MKKSNRMVSRRSFVAGGAAITASATLPKVNIITSAAASEYYAGRTIEVIVPFAEGGVTDVVARFLQPFLQEHIPGNPTVNVRNRAGGGSVLGANYFEQNAQPDGELILFTTSSTSFPFMLGQEGVEYDLLSKRAGYAIAIGPVVYAAPETGIESAAQLLEPETRLIYGGIGATGSDLPVLLAFELLDLDVQTVLGFDGRGPIRLAFEAGETNLDFQFTAVYLTQVQPLVEEGRAVPLMTGGSADADGNFTERDPVISDLPSVYEVYRDLHGEDPSGPAWDAYQAAAGLTFQNGLTAWMHGDTPDEVISALDQAVEAINNDPEFQRRGAEVTGGYQLQYGGDATRLARSALDPSDEVRAWLTELLTEKYGVSL